MLNRVVDQDLELREKGEGGGGGGGGCFACPASISSFCEFFSFYSKKCRWGGPPDASPRSATGISFVGTVGDELHVLHNPTILCTRYTA